MRILLLTPGFPQSEEDTTCIPALQALVRELHNRYRSEIDLQVVSIHYPFRKGSYNWFEIPCWSAGGSNVNFPSKTISWLRALRFIYRLHRQNPFDIIHSFWLQECTLLGQQVARLTGARHITQIMGQDVLPLNKYVKLFNRKQITVVANSRFSAAKLYENFNWQSQFVVPFGIRYSDFEGIPVYSKRDIDVLAVGSLIPLKDHAVFIEIFSELAEIFPEIKGKIIGDGPLMQILSAMIHEKGLSKNLQLTGKMERVQVLNNMARSKILLHTSNFESAGYVFLEALHSGMKVVSFKTGFLPDAEGAFQCDDKMALGETIRRLLSDDIIFKPAVVPLMSETAKQIHDIYFEK